ncbi:MAG: ATP-binding cassette domain-containing protein, partial [Roseimicrobium sp.]
MRFPPGARERLPRLPLPPDWPTASPRKTRPSPPPPFPASMLSANELTLSYGNHRLLDGVTLAVNEGEKVGLVGRNGSGKTSLLKILAGTERPD